MGFNSIRELEASLDLDENSKGTLWQPGGHLYRLRGAHRRRFDFKRNGENYALLFFAQSFNCLLILGTVVSMDIGRGRYDAKKSQDRGIRTI